MHAVASPAGRRRRPGPGWSCHFHARSGGEPRGIGSSGGARPRRFPGRDLAGHVSDRPPALVKGCEPKAGAPTAARYRGQQLSTDTVRARLVGNSTDGPRAMCLTVLPCAPSQPARLERRCERPCGLFEGEDVTQPRCGAPKKGGGRCTPVGGRGSAAVVAVPPGLGVHGATTVVAQRRGVGAVVPHVVAAPSGSAPASSHSPSPHRRPLPAVSTCF